MRSQNIFLSFTHPFISRLPIVVNIFFCVCFEEVRKKKACPRFHLRSNSERLVLQKVLEHVEGASRLNRRNHVTSTANARKCQAIVGGDVATDLLVQIPRLMCLDGLEVQRSEPIARALERHDAVDVA